MPKKMWSVILFCFITATFLFTVALTVSTGISLYSISNNEIDLSGDRLPGASVLGVLYLSTAVWIGFLFQFFVSSVGWLASFVNTKIASNRIIKTASTIFVCLYSVVMLWSIGVLTYGLIAPYFV